MTRELKHLSRNLWWTWNPEAQEIFGELSPLTWRSSNHNAVAVLNSLSHLELKARLMEKDFAARVSDVLVEFRAYLVLSPCRSFPQEPGRLFQRRVCAS